MSTEPTEPTDARPASEHPLPGGDFRLFTTRLSIQGMMSLGLLENPINGKRGINRASAKMILEDLVMLAERTSGNLDADEAMHLSKVIRDLEQAAQKVLGEG